MLLLRRQYVPATLWAHLPLSFPSQTHRRLPCLERKGMILLTWKKERLLCSETRSQNCQGKCSGTQRSDSHSARPPVTPQLGSLQNVYPKGQAILHEDVRLGGVQKIHRNWAVLDPFPHLLPPRWSLRGISLTQKISSGKREKGGMFPESDPDQPPYFR